MHRRTEAVRLKVGRAREHITDLDRRIHNFFAGPPNPYPILKSIDAETGDTVFKLGSCAPVPRDFPLLIGDALQNLRTALDHLVWQLIISNGEVPDERNSQFPMNKSADEYKASSPRKIKGVAPEVANMIDKLRPYGGGNEDLYGLHLLNNVDKHRLLLMCGAAHAGLTVQVQLSPTPTEFRIPIPVQWSYPLKDGDEIYRVPKDATTLSTEPRFSFRIAFGDAEAMGSEPLLPPLAQLANYVDAVVMAFDKFMK
jgi:hypothetical protein